MFETFHKRIAVYDHVRSMRYMNVSNVRISNVAVDEINTCSRQKINSKLNGFFVICIKHEIKYNEDEGGGWGGGGYLF